MVKNGQSVSVIGPRRIGKTSFLFHISNPSVRDENGLDAKRSLFVYIDGETLGGLSKSEILHTMLQETVLQSTKVRIDLSPTTDHRSFEQALRKLIRPGQQLVYLIDEFECLSKNPNLDADFFSFLRSLNARFNIAYVTVSLIPLLTLVDEGSQLSSPFFNIFVPIPLGLFSEDDARRLIREPSREAGVKFSKDAEEFVLALVGPHPFFLQIACYHALELWRDDPAFGEHTHRQLEKDVQADLRSHFEYFAKKLSDEERRTLACILEAGHIATSTAIVEELERKCLVHQRDGEYALVSRAFAHFVEQHIGTTLAATTVEGERRMATVLFVDIVGSTSMADQHKPEEFWAIIKRAQQVFVNVVDHYGGKVAHFGGDSTVVLFGVPAERSDDAARAVRAALEIQAQVATYAYELKQSKGIDFSARVGLNTGLVVLGEIGGEQRTEYTALGDAVNLAQRMETLAQPGTIVISDHTYQQVRGWFSVEALGAVQVKGKSELIKAYRVLAERTKER